MDQPEKKPRGLLRRPLFWGATVLLAAGASVFFIPVWTCPLCQGVPEGLVVSRTTRACVVCEGTRKVSFREFLEKRIK